MFPKRQYSLAMASESFVLAVTPYPLSSYSPGKSQQPVHSFSLLSHST